MAEEEEEGFTFHFGTDENEADDWENLPLEKLKIVRTSLTVSLSIF
jgi:hypothetical protein